MAIVLLAIQSADASIIGNWSGSSRSWNNGDMSTLKSTMITAGHTVEADEAISAANLANDDVFVVGEPTSSPLAGELTDLSSWVSTGGILLLLGDSGGSGQAGLNAIAAAIGSSLVWGGSPSNSALAGGNFASEGPPFNIVGQLLATTPGTAVSGGNALAGTYLQYQQIGSGWVFGFADRLDHNFFAPTSSNTNGQLFLNIVEGEITAVPEPASITLIGIGAATLMMGAFRRKQKLAA